MVSGIQEITKTAVRYIRKYFNLDCAILGKNDQNALEYKVLNDTNLKLSENDFSVASWVFKHSMKAGKYTATLPSGLLYLLSVNRE